MPNELKTIYTFSVKINREVDKVTETKDGDAIIKTTTKVNELTPIYFALKNPSRAERELAEEERAAWWSHYVEKGILPRAILLKTYANYGDVLSDTERTYYFGMQADYRLNEEELGRLNATEADSSEKRLEIMKKQADLRDRMLAFEQERAVFFDNTAEAKAQAKMTQYLVLTLSYTRSDDTKDWEPLFKGGTTKERLLSLDKLLEAQDEAFGQAYPMLSFVAHLYSTSNGGINTEALHEYFNEVSATQGSVS